MSSVLHCTLTTLNHDWHIHETEIQNIQWKSLGHQRVFVASEPQRTLTRHGRTEVQPKANESQLLEPEYNLSQVLRPLLSLMLWKPWFAVAHVTTCDVAFPPGHSQRIISVYLNWGEREAILVITLLNYARENKPFKVSSPKLHTSQTKYI